jgi:hypothetical protein
MESASATRSQTVGNGTLVQLRGIDDIRTNVAVPQEVRDILMMHASALPPNQIDHYIVNVQLAQAWLATHPEPQAAKGAASAGDSGSGCHAISIECAEDAGQHAVSEAERQAGRLYQQAQASWQNMVGQAAQDWNVASSCMADNTLALPNIPVQFSVNPSIPLSFSTNGSSNVLNGSVSGSVAGTAAFGLPVSTNFNAEVDMFYIPCLPFVIRPKSMIADGSLTIGQTFTASVNAKGQFQQSFTIPPSGGALIPIEVIPIVIAGIPVAEMDVSLFLEGTLDVSGQGTLNGAVKVQSQQNTGFQFNCSGSGCSLISRTASLPTTTTESVQVQGQINVKPGVYIALQLDFDVDALSARAGPRPYLLGQIYGCQSASATQALGGRLGDVQTLSSTTQQNSALFADLDWGVDLIASASVAGQTIGNPYTYSSPLPAPKNHIAFWDLAHGSTALLPVVTGSVQPALGTSTPYALRMPSCYPYPDQLEYQASWTGGASASNTPPSGAAATTVAAATAAQKILTTSLGAGQSTAPAPAPGACGLQSAQADCWGTPQANTPLYLGWPQMGSYGLTVSALRDKHGRVFNPPGTTQLGVNVQQSSASATTQ